jgi:hypothetical protein
MTMMTTILTRTTIRGRRDEEKEKSVEKKGGLAERLLSKISRQIAQARQKTSRQRPSLALHPLLRQSKREMQ